MRLLIYDPNKKASDSSGGTSGDSRQTPPDGDYIALVERIGDPALKKDRYTCQIDLGIVGMNARIAFWIECNSDGTWADNWKGLTKWNSFCEALNLKEGTYNDGAFVGCPLMVTVATTEKSGKKYKNVTKMWACSQSESDRAADWLAQHME